MLLILTSWGTAKFHLMHWHKISGYCVLALLLARLCWGFFGSSTARFKQFIAGPRAVWKYARHFFSAAPSNSIGHNPMGALSVIALLVALSLQVATGLILSDTDFINSGPLSSLVSYDVSATADRLHKISFTVIEILILLHVAVILFYMLRKHENLIRPMVTGVKQAPLDPSARPLYFAPSWRAAVLLLITAGFVYWLVTDAVPRIPGF